MGWEGAADVRLLVPWTFVAIGIPGAFQPLETLSPVTVDSLLIAAAQRNGSLIAIARYADGTWDPVTWSQPFDLDDIQPTTTGDGTWRLPGGDTVAVGVPPSWHLYSEVERGTPMTTTGFRISGIHCSTSWVLTTDRTGLQSLEGTWLAGVALSAPPQAVLSEEDIPDLERIRVDLDLVDRPSRGDGRRTFHWLGFFRIDGAVVGVVHGQYYEGDSLLVVLLQGDRSRVLSRLHAGGC